MSSDFFAINIKRKYNQYVFRIKLFMDISPQKSSQYSYIKYALQNIDEITTYFNIPVGNSKREIIEYLQSEDFDVVKKMKLYDEFERQVTEKIKTNQIQYITHGSE